ncbi:MAG: RICIN domain-containing protein [Reinekea sp.]
MKKVVCLALLSGLSLATSASYAAVPESLGWDNIKMGGGGYIPGVIYHPTERDVRYARTDMLGVYRWDKNKSAWTPITDSFTRAEGKYLGAESIAVDPTNSNKVYMATGMYTQSGNGRLYYSENRGDTWKHVELPFPVGSNDDGRALGERLVVDPNLPSTMFYATRTAGLWKSTDSGLKWSQVTSLSSHVMTDRDLEKIRSVPGRDPVGMSFVMMDASVPTSGFSPTNRATSTLYAGITPDYKKYAGLTSFLYKSTDGGANWTPVAIPKDVTSTIDNAKLYIPHMVRAEDGALYVPFTTNPGPGSGAPSSLYKFDGNGTWTKLTSSSDGDYFGGIGGLSVYGSGSSTKIAFGVSGTWGDSSWIQVAMRSDDGGETWTEFGRSGDESGSNDYHDASGTTEADKPSYWGWIDDLDIDPFNPDHISYVTGGGIWSTKDGFSAQYPSWDFDVHGIEEMVNLDMKAPPPDASYILASTHGDIGAYVHTSLTDGEEANKVETFGFSNGTGIDIAWRKPAYIAAVATVKEKIDGKQQSVSRGAYTTDSGASWTRFSGYPSFANKSNDSTKMAVTADAKNLIWSSGRQIPQYSTDNGATWTSTNLPSPDWTYHIAADRQNPKKVYAFDHGGNWWYASNSARFYYSLDGGHTFTASSQTWDPKGFNETDLEVNPFTEGDVWLADGDNLWHSKDSGATWTKLTSMATVGSEPTSKHGAIDVALGAPAKGASYSASVFFVGTINGTDGVYQSDNEGKTWTRINDDNHSYGGINRIVADTKMYGRVYLAARGMHYNLLADDSDDKDGKDNSGNSSTLIDSGVLRSKLSNRCADVSGWGTKDGVKVQLWDCAGSTNQTWKTKTTSGGYYNLVAQHSDKCLDVSGYSTSKGSAVKQWKCKHSHNQEWLPIDKGDGYIQLKARHSGLCLSLDGNGTSKGTGLVQSSCSGDSTLWKLEELKVKLNETFSLRSKLSDRCADVTDWGTDNGTDIQIWDCDDHNNQEWKAKATSNGYYSLESKHSNKCLDVYGYKTSQGASIKQWTCQGNPNQEWLPVAKGNGYFHLRARHSELCLGLSGNATDNGTKLVQSSCSGSGVLWKQD